MKGVLPFLFKQFATNKFIAIIAIIWSLIIGVSYSIVKSMPDLLILSTLVVGLSCSIFRQLYDYKNNTHIATIQFLEMLDHCSVELGNVIRTFFNYLVSVKGFFLLFGALYLTTYALEPWVDYLQAATKVNIAYSLVYIKDFTLGASWLLTWLIFSFIYITDILNKPSAELLNKILKELGKNGISIPYIHGKYGQCKMDVNKVLDSLVNNGIVTSETNELYWLIRKNYYRLSRMDLYPMGKRRILRRAFYPILGEGN